MKRLDPGELQAIVDDNRWPAAFDTYESLLQAGLDAGRSVRFVNPETSSMSDTIADLARARPGITVTELAILLSIDVATASELALKATRTHGVQVTFDAD